VKPRILVIRGGAIGDFILTLPALRLLREAFPAAHLEILGYKHIVALAEGRFYADATRSIEYSAMAGFFVPNSELAPDLVEYFAGFQQIVSYLYDPSGFFEGNLRRAGAKQIISAFSPINDTAHAAHQLAQPLQRLALFLEDPAATVHLTNEDRAFAERFLADVDDRPVIALHPGSGSARKNWPVSRWAAVGKSLLERERAPQLLLIGGEADEAPLSALRDAWSGAPVLLAHDLPLPALAAVLERCSLFLGHDSGISHLAAAVGAPCLLIFGPTDPAVWAPMNAQVQVLEAAGGDLSHITAEAVQEEIERRLGERLR
jgi:heptosyltransferase-2